MARESTWQWRKTRRYVFARDGMRCWRCGCALTTHDRKLPTHATIGHVVSHHDGGSDQPSNLHPECMRCNTTDGGMMRTREAKRERLNTGLDW